MMVLKFGLILGSIYASEISNWNWDESQIHFNFQGGFKNMIFDLFGDFGYPKDFVNLFEDLNTDSVINAIKAVSFSSKLTYTFYKTCYMEFLFYFNTE